MTNPISFLKTQLKNLYFEFDQIEISYEYRKRIDTHIIEIKPFSLYESHAYLDKEIDLEDKFIEKFPNENILFISENSLTEINSSDLILKLELNKYKDECYTTFSNILMDMNSSSFTSKNGINYITLTCDNLDVNNLPKINYDDLLFTSCDNYTTKIDISSTIVLNKISDIPGNNNFALAA